MLQALFTRIQSIWRDHQKFRFLVVGASNTAFGYGVFTLLYLLLGSHLHYTFIQLMSHVISVIYAYVVHRRYTFESTRPWLAEFLRFNVSYLGSLSFSLVSLPLLIRYAGLTPVSGALVVTLVSVMLSYVFHRYYSFKTSARAVLPQSSGSE